jgi:DNA-binding transcriptional LysR family regulator
MSRLSDSLTIGSPGALADIQLSARGVRKIDTTKVTELLDRVRWDDLQTLRLLSSRRSFRSAAESMSLSVNTLRSRLDRLEKALATTLFARSSDGLELTADGRAVVDVAQSMYSASAQLPRGRGNRVLVHEEKLSICASEGVGTFWLTPRLLDLRQRLNGMTVSLDCFSDQSKLQPREHDISVGFERPTDPDAVSFRAATMHMVPYASHDYIARHGEPTSLDEIEGHKCIQQDAPGLNYDILQHFLGTESMKTVTQFRVNSSFALFWAVSSGIGIAGLPTYISGLSNRIRPLNMPIRLKFDLWISYHGSSRGSWPVRLGVDWLRDSFDSRRYPWFREAFVDPSDIDVEPLAVDSFGLLDHLVDG